MSNNFLNIEDTVSVLKAHNDWRLGKLEETPCSPRALTVAMNSALHHLSKECSKEFLKDINYE